jgi:drug/metabolite transporter (DMT)-like permease
MLLIVTISWGMTFPLTKISLNYISPVLLVFFRFLITIILFNLFFFKEYRSLKFTDLRLGIILGVFLFLGFAFQTIGLRYTSASKSAFITGTNLVVIPFAQYFILKTKPKKENVIGAFVVMLGLYVLTEAYFTTPGIGDILTLICAFCFAIHIVLLDKYSRETGFNILVFGQFLTMVIMSLLFVIFFEAFLFNEIFFEVNLKIIFIIIFTSLFATLIAITFMTRYQKETTPLRAGVIYNMESIFAVIFSFFILGEIMNFNQIVGVIIMLIGLFISEFFGLLRLKAKNEN